MATQGAKATGSRPPASRVPQPGGDGPGPLSSLHPAVRAWFSSTLGEPTPPQVLAWPLIARGDSVLIEAPTGSGKTLAAFLQCLNLLYQRAAAGEDLDRTPSVQVLYVSPLKALNNDIERNLERPLAGIVGAAAGLGIALPRLRTAVRTGDTPPDVRRAIVRQPPHVLITTPESLGLILCSQARKVLAGVRTVIVDEIHALFTTKRGTHLALLLEQLEDLAGRPLQRIGLSATQRPLDQVAAFLGGGEVVAAPAPDAAAETAGAGASAGPGAAGATAAAVSGLAWRPRPVSTVATPGRKELDLRVLVPVPDFRDLPGHTVWPEIQRTIWNLVRQHRSTLVFVNNRQAGERVAAALNDLAGEEVCRVHHGSISREQRLETERRLKAGELPCLVATSTLELGIDVGAIDLVVQVESPHEVARGLQRVGRAGHVLSLPSKGRLVAKTRQDLVEMAVVAREMLAGRIECHRAQENALDVLAQFVAGLVIAGPRRVDDLYRLVRQCYNYRALPRADFDAVLDMVSGAHDTGEYLGLRPLVYWDRVNGLVSSAERGRRLVFVSGGTIPDRGQFGVFMQGSGVKLGELDEEFVYERRVGDRFTLGTSGWRITHIQPDKVVVVPASGGPRVPFWRGEGPGRPYELGCVVADFLAEAEEALAREAEEALTREAGQAPSRRPDPFWERLGAEAALDPDGLDNLRRYLAAQREATGRLPSRRALVVEEFRDRLGQWQVILHSPFGRRVNEPLSMLLAEDLRRRTEREPDVVATDDGISFGFAAGESPPLVDPAALDPDPARLTERVAGLVRSRPLFGLLFREAAARALILPRLPYGRRRTPLWLSRRKAAGLLEVVERIPGFPLLGEAYREALGVVYDLPGLREVVAGLAEGSIEVVRTRREAGSPFAQPVLFAAMGAFFYGDDLPKAERRVRYLGLDPEALTQLLGRAPLRQLLDAEAIEETRRPATPASLLERPPSSPDELHHWLLEHGELPAAGLPPDIEETLAALRRAGRAETLSWPAPSGPGPVWLAAEDLPLYREALGAEGKRVGTEGRAGPEGLEGGALEAEAAAAAPVTAAAGPAARARLALRFARRFSPFEAAELAGWYGWPADEAGRVLAALGSERRLRAGEFRPGGVGQEWSDPALLEEMHRRSLARARRAVEPASPAAFALHLERWQGTARGRAADPGSLASVLRQLAGLALPAWAWERAILPARLDGYAPALLDAMLGSGQVRWAASGSLDDLRVAFYPIEGLWAGGSDPAPRTPAGAEARGGADGATRQGSGAAAVRRALSAGGALFLRDLWGLSGLGPAEILAVLEEMMLAGEVTNDTFGPVRHLLSLGPRYRALPRVMTPAVLRATGRWSLCGDLAAPPPPEERCRLLLQRYGLLSREVAAAEGIAWGELLPQLSRLEILGQVRRGYFVRGLGGLQYALPEAVESLREARAARAAHAGGEAWAGLEAPAAHPGGPAGARPAAGLEAPAGPTGLSGMDPALAWGGVLAWPEEGPRPRRPVAVVTVAGMPVLAAEGRPLRLFPMAGLRPEELPAALAELVRVASSAAGPGGRLEIAEYGGRPVTATPTAALIEELGFERGPQTMQLWLGGVTPV